MTSAADDSKITTKKAKQKSKMKTTKLAETAQDSSPVDTTFIKNEITSFSFEEISASRCKINLCF